MRVISLATSGPRTCAREPLAVAVGATTCDVATTVATSVGTGGVVVGDNGVGLTCARAVGVAADVGRPRTAGASVARTVGTASTDSVSTGSTGLLETQAVTTMATTTMVPECLIWLASVILECAQAYVPRPRDSSPACWDLLSGPSDALAGSKPAAMAAPEQALKADDSQTAKSSYEAALEREETTEVLLGLGQAISWKGLCKETSASSARRFHGHAHARRHLGHTG